MRRVIYWTVSVGFVLGALLTLIGTVLLTIGVCMNNADVGSAGGAGLLAGFLIAIMCGIVVCEMEA